MKEEITLDANDRAILSRLQRDASISIEALAADIALSRNACWRRIQRLEQEGVITGRVALVDPERLGCGQTVFVLVRTSRHDHDWMQQFRRAVESLPEIVGVYRAAGDIDYILMARVASVKAYDRLYQRLIEKVPLTDVSASFVMEEIKETTACPIP